MNYQDFDIQIESTTDGYRVNIESEMGSASNLFQLPFTPIEIENYMLKIGATRNVTRRIDSPRTAAAREFGQRLFTAIFDNQTLARFSSAQDQARLNQKGLRIRLNLQNVPELGALPWEFLYNPDEDSFLSLSKTTPIVRFLRVPQPDPPLATQLPLRILGIISSPTDLTHLNVEAEKAHLEKALTLHQKNNALELHWLERPTLSALRITLRRTEYHILHFIGHGFFDEAQDEGALIFEDEQGRGRIVSASVLATLVRDHSQIRLIVLNACEGGRVSNKDPFAGVAPALLRAGLPAVIAMQFEVTDQTAILFAREFYGAIVEGHSVYTALSDARLAIFAENQDVEWGTPVLYLRAQDGVIFDLPPGVLKIQAQSVSEDAITASGNKAIIKHRFLMYWVLASIVGLSVIIFLFSSQLISRIRFSFNSESQSASEPEVTSTVSEREVVTTPKLIEATKLANPTPPYTPTAFPIFTSKPTPALPITPILEQKVAMISTQEILNVRNGPDLRYPIIGKIQPSENYSITGKNESGTWWQINFKGEKGWVFSNLVTTTANVDSISVVNDIPTLPTPTITSIPATSQDLFTIDDFESARLDDFIINRYALAQGNKGKLYLVSSPNIMQGQQALAFDFEINVTDPRYIGYGRTLSKGQDWSKYTELCFWVKGNISPDAAIDIQIGVSDNAVAHYNIPRAYYIDPGTEAHCIALRSNKWTASENKGDLTSIAHFAIYVSGSIDDRGTIYVDNIYLK